MRLSQMSMIRLLSVRGAAIRRSEKGTALVELAVVLPLLVLFAIGAAEFGRLYFASITIANAARAGAQFGAQNAISSANFAGMTAAAQNEAADLGTITNFPSQFCRCPDGSAPACIGGASCAGYGTVQIFVKDSAVKVVNLILRYPGLPASVTVNKTAIFRVQ
jgi:Flp pilus assembly protein TadG